MIYCNYPGIISAGMVELADTMDLGSIGQPCRFKSCYPHQQKKARRKRYIACGELFHFIAELIVRSFCCFSIPN